MGIDPGSIVLGAQILGGVLGVVGTIQQVSSQNAQYAYQAGIARNNQIIAQRNARYAEEQGTRRETDEIMRVRGFIGAQKAAQAASGVDINSGTPAAVREGTSILGNRSIRNVRDETMRVAHGYRTQGAGFAAEAKNLDASRSSPFMPVVGSLIGTAASVGGTVMDFRRDGVPSFADWFVSA